MSQSASQSGSRPIDGDGKLLILLVGASGFEPETSCAQGRRATRLRYAPTWRFILNHFGAPFHAGLASRPRPPRRWLKQSRRRG